SRRRHTRSTRDWSSDVCSSDLGQGHADARRRGKIIGQITTNWDFNTAKNLAEANLTAATTPDKGTVFILAPNDGTARAIADAFRSEERRVGKGRSARLWSAR